MTFADKLIRDYEIIAKIITDRERAENMKQQAKEIMTRNRRSSAPTSPVKNTPATKAPFLSLVKDKKSDEKFQDALKLDANVVEKFEHAEVIKTEIGFVGMWKGGGDAKMVYKTKKEAEDAYYIQIASDSIGAGIRDNSRAEKIQWGKDIEKYGADEEGFPDIPGVGK